MPNSQESSSGLSVFGGVQPGGAQPESTRPSDDAGACGVLKCYFYTPKRGDIWGAFCFMFDCATGESMDNVFWVTRELVGPAIDTALYWKSLNKLIPKMGAYEKVLGDKLSVLMLESFTSALRAELCRSSNPTELLETISGEIRNSFERTTHCFLEFKMAFERVSGQEVSSAGVLTKENAQTDSVTDKTKPEEKSFAGTLINCQPVIDPVNGKPVSELEPDDMVEVKIQGGVGAGEMIYKFLESTNQDAIFPVEHVESATVNNTEKTYVFLKINEEVKGLITVTKDIRLRVININGNKKTSITLNMDNIVLFGVFAVAAVVIFAAVRYLTF